MKSKQSKSSLPAGLRWLAILTIIGLIFGAAVFWIIQGAQAIIPIVILTALGTFIGFLQVLPQLFPSEKHENVVQSEALLKNQSKNHNFFLDTLSHRKTGILVSDSFSINQNAESSDLSIYKMDKQQHKKYDELDNMFQFVAYREDVHPAGLFYGRNKELAILSQWISNDQCQLVVILGVGGIGKTALAEKLYFQSKQSFERVIWRSLRDAPPLNEVLRNCIQVLTDQPQLNLSEMEEAQTIFLLVELMKTQHCLIVFDNLESILLEGRQTGYYRKGYEGYGKFFQRVGEIKHNSTLLLTSREKPREVAILEGETSPVKSYRLQGLDLDEGRAILKDKGLQGKEQNWEKLILQYAGNPLALKLVSQFIKEVFDGDILTFLEDEKKVFSGVRDVLDQQFERLSIQEKEVLYWLAIEREPVVPVTLQEDIIHPIAIRDIQEILQSLLQRSLIEHEKVGFTLQSVIMEYVVEKFVHSISEEIKTGLLNLFRAFLLIRSNSKDYIRDGQVRLILMPLAELLEKEIPGNELEKIFRQILSNARKDEQKIYNYISGNTINILIQLHWNIQGWDFSDLVVHQAFLRNAHLQAVNFANSDLSKSVFTEAFDDVLSIAYSPDGTSIALGATSGGIWIWRISSNILKQTFDGHSGWVNAISFSPNGTMLISGGDDQIVRLWEIKTGNCLYTFQGHTDRVKSVAFSPDGTMIVSGSHDQTIRLWNVNTGGCLRILQGHTDRVKSVAFSPDGTMIVSGGDDQTMRLWEVKTGDCLHILQGHTDQVKSVAFSPDGTMLGSGGDDQTIRLWDVKTGDCSHILQGHTDRVTSVTFSPNNTIIASGSRDKSIRLWDVKTGQYLRILQGHPSWVTSITFSPDGIVLASGGGESIRLWEISTGYCLCYLHGYTCSVRSVILSSDQTMIISGNGDGSIRLWNIDTQKCLYILAGHNQWIWSVAFSPSENIIASGGGDRTIRLWDVSAGKCIAVMYGHNKWVKCVVFSPNGKLIATGSGDQDIRLWEVGTRKCLLILHGHSGEINSVNFSPDGKWLVSGGNDRIIRVWEVATGKCFLTLHGHSGEINSVNFSPDGKWLVSGGNDRIIRVWEIDTEKCIYRLEGHTGQVNVVIFRSDSQQVVSGSDDEEVRIWEVATEKCLNTLQGHKNRVSSICIDVDDVFIYTGSDDETIRIWNIENGLCSSVLKNEGPYEKMNITGVKGLTNAQVNTLKRLGAVEN